MVLDRLKRKFANAAKYVPKPELTGKGDNEVGIVSVGSCDGAVREAIDVLDRQKIARRLSAGARHSRSAARWRHS